MGESIPQKPEEEISPEELSQKVSLLMTKPENTDTALPLLLMLKNKGLKAKSFRFILDEKTLNKLYPEMNEKYPEIIREATIDYMLGKEVEVFLITKDEENDTAGNVLKKLVDLVGEKTIPEDNPHGTLRRHHSGGTKLYVSKSLGKAKFYENGFHRPLSTDELIGNLDAFGLLDEARKLALES